MKNIVDPKKPQPRPKHNITKEMFVGNNFMPWRKKTEEEIPRISDHLIHEEDIEHEHIYVDPEHIKEAEQNHAIDLKVREKRRKADLEKAKSFMDQELDNAENAEQDGTVTKEELEELRQN